MTSKPRAEREVGEEIQDRRVDVSIIIVSWNTRDILRDCLRSVYENAGDVWFEVVVVDNGSTDDSAEMVESEFPRARLIRNSENLGFAAGHNGRSGASIDARVRENRFEPVQIQGLATACCWNDVRRPSQVLGFLRVLSQISVRVGTA